MQTEGAQEIQQAQEKGSVVARLERGVARVGGCGVCAAAWHAEIVGEAGRMEDRGVKRLYPVQTRCFAPTAVHASLAGFTLASTCVPSAQASIRTGCTALELS